jgi:Zn-dependent peptidase ImmA (M78 family)
MTVLRLKGSCQVLSVKNDISPIAEAVRLTRLWQQHGPNFYPLEIDDLIAGMFQNGSFECELTTKRGRFETFEGCLRKVEDSNNWVILLNDNIQNKRRQRFTHAHELGHFLCHRHLQTNFEDSPHTLNEFKDRIEFEANQFAAWLLMPANLVRSEFHSKKWNTATLQEMGYRFQSSLQSSGLRFVDLSQKPVAFVVSRDGYVVWAKSNENAPFMEVFKNGDEIPVGSSASNAGLNPAGLPIQTGKIWSNSSGTIESSYRDPENDFIYTCLEFTG